YHLRGTTVCKTGLLTPMEATNQAVLQEFEHRILNPKVVAVAFREGLAELHSSQDTVVPRRAALQADLAVLEQQLTRLSEAIATGGDAASLIDAVRVREQRKHELQAELSGLQSVENIAAVDFGQLQQELEARLSEWRELLGRQAPVARQILKKLVDGRIVF